MLIKKPLPNNYVAQKTTLYLLSLLLFSISPHLSKIEATNSVNMKDISTKSGNQGSRFYISNHYKNISHEMHPEIKTPQEAVNKEWESVTYSPEEAYIQLKEKMYKGKVPKNQKKLLFSDIANQY
ncbi:hypothetical protein CL658_04365 [bacterium]|nr:hypothetical protein [bacterium]|tara:strand:+ start:655 stop:1029 length:375 start_codon:yes stop_codon:yes gene_type:complete